MIAKCYWNIKFVVVSSLFKNRTRLIPTWFLNHLLILTLVPLRLVAHLHFRKINRLVQGTLQLL